MLVNSVASQCGIPLPLPFLGNYVFEGSDNFWFVFPWDVMQRAAVESCRIVWLGLELGLALGLD